MKFEDYPVAIHGPEDMIAVIPYLLGFHPTRSLVVLGICGERRVIALRADLVPATHYPALISRVALKLTTNRARSAALVGYGTREEAMPVLAAVRDGIGGMVPVTGSLRVDDGRWWPAHCDDPACCSPEGVRFDSAATVVAARAVAAGLVALPDRDALAALVAPVTGDERQRMLAATKRAEDEVLRGRRDASHLSERGLAFLVRMLRMPRPLGDQEAARLALFLTSTGVRDEAVARTGAGPESIGFWADLTRRAVGRYAAGPACLLAIVAYAEGDGALANLALDRALGAEPGYPLAKLLRRSLDAAVPPQRIRGLLTAAAFGPDQIRQGTVQAG